MNVPLLLFATSSLQHLPQREGAAVSRQPVSLQAFPAQVSSGSPLCAQSDNSSSKELVCLFFILLRGWGRALLPILPSWDTGWKIPFLFSCRQAPRHMPWAALASPCPASPLHQQKHHIQAQAGAMLWLNTKGRGGGRLLRDDVGSHKTGCGSTYAAFRLPHFTFSSRSEMWGPVNIGACGRAKAQVSFMVEVGAFLKGINCPKRPFNISLPVDLFPQYPPQTDYIHP